MICWYEDKKKKKKRRRRRKRKSIHKHLSSLKNAQVHPLVQSARSRFSYFPPYNLLTTLNCALHAAVPQIAIFYTINFASLKSVRWHCFRSMALSFPFIILAGFLGGIDVKIAGSLSFRFIFFILMSFTFFTFFALNWRNLCECDEGRPAFPAVGICKVL